MQINYSKRIFGLDLLRCVAILLVLLTHLLYIFPEASGTVVDLIRLSGVMGVELFFVLSGFLIGRILFKIVVQESFNSRKFKYFLIRRWFRTLPNYYLVLGLNIGIALYFGRELPDTLGAYFLFLQNAISGMDVFFTESWSLPIEEFAYIIGPLLLYVMIQLGLKHSKKKLFLITTIIILLFFFATKIHYHFSTPWEGIKVWNVNLKAVLFYRIDAIYYGVLAAYCSLVFPLFWKSNAISLCVLGIIGFWVFQFGLGFLVKYPSLYSFVWDVVYLPYNSICIALLLPVLSQWKSVSAVVAKLITFISIISYSMYLLHYSIVLQLMRYVQPIEDLSFSQKVFFGIVYFLITIVLSYGLYRVFEKPVMDLRDYPKIKNRFEV